MFQSHSSAKMALFREHLSGLRVYEDPDFGSKCHSPVTVCRAPRLTLDQGWKKYNVNLRHLSYLKANKYSQNAGDMMCEGLTGQLRGFCWPNLGEFEHRDDH